MLRGRPDFGKIFLYFIARRRIVHSDVVESDDGVHGRPDLMTHVGEKGGFGLVGVLGRRQGVPQGLPVLRKFLFLLFLPLDSPLQLLPVLFFLRLQDKAVQHGGSQHVTHGIERHQRVKHLDTDQDNHGNAEQTDGQMTHPDGALRPGGDPQRIDGSQQEHNDLYRQRRIPRRAGVIGAALIEAEQDRAEEIDQDDDDLEGEKDFADQSQPLFEAGLTPEIGNDILRPQHHRGSHCRKMNHRIDVEDRRQPCCLQDSPQQIRDIVSQHPHQEMAVTLPGRRPVFLFPQNIPVADEQDDGCQYSDNRISHNLGLRAVNPLRSAVHNIDRISFDEGTDVVGGHIHDPLSCIFCRP